MHIIDNGRGINENDMKTLFNMFGKLKRTAKINSDGLGMGLMVVDKLVKLNNGSIKVSSDGKGKGSIFTFTMKMYIPELNFKQSSDIELPEISQNLNDKSKHI